MSIKVLDRLLVHNYEKVIDIFGQEVIMTFTLSTNDIDATAEQRSEERLKAARAFRRGVEAAIRRSRRRRKAAAQRTN